MTESGKQTSRRTFLGTVAMGAAAWAMPRVAFGAEAKRPNILILQPDQHRGTIMGCAGDKQIMTPNLDRLAAEGTRFSHNVSASPVCSPFRATFQTGLFPHKHGVVHNELRLNPKFKGFAEVFAAAGYATGYIGKWHVDGGVPKKEGGEGVTPKAVGGVVPPERRHGWQEWNGYEKAHEYFEVWKYNEQGKKERVKGYDWEPTWQTDVALDFIKRHSAEKKPWLYYLAYGPPHNPEECPDKFLSMYDPAKFVLPPDIAGRLAAKDEESLRKLLQIYYGQVTSLDVEVGRLLDGLKKMGIDDNTIILYTSDHGDRLGAHWTGQHGPEQNAAKAESGKKEKKKKKGGEDGGEDSGEIGKMRGKACPYSTAFRTPLLVRWPGHIKAGQVCDTPTSSINLTPTVLDLAGLEPIAGMQGDSVAGWCLKGDGPRHEGVWIGLGGWRAAYDGHYVYSPVGYNHLYDLQTDPCEMKNLIKSPEHKDVRQRMQDLLVKLAEKAEDPMLPEIRAVKVS